MLVEAKNFGTTETLPLFRNLDFHQTPEPMEPMETVGEAAKRKCARESLCCEAVVKRTGAYLATGEGTSSLHTTATPNRD